MANSKARLTEKDVIDVLEIWIGRLNLYDWDITWITDPENDEHLDGLEKQDNFASIWRTKDYKVAKLGLNKDWPEWDRFDLNQNIVHELLHLVTREVEFILDQLDGLLHNDVEKTIVEGHRHAVEGAIDSLAYRLCEIGGIV